MHMKPLKKYIWAMSFLFIGQSCNNILDITPIENNVSNSFYSNELEIQQAVVGIYARLGRNGTNTDFATDYFLLASEDRSDIRYLGGGETSAQNDQLDLRKYLVTSFSGTVQSIFSRLYTLIKEANNLLSHTNEGEYMRYRAEAAFLRAYAYSELARSFGPVAIVTEPIENAAAIALPRAPLQEVYAQIIQDLEYAAANLDLVYTGDQSGHVGSLAAKSLLGEVYMTMAGYPLNDATGYQKAETTFAGIIEQVNQRFAPDYKSVFTLENENKYDIFSIQFSSGNVGTGSSLPGYITNSGSGASPYPEWTYPTYGQQGQDLRIDSILVNEMLKNDDKRLFASVDTGYWSSLNTATRTWVSRNIVTKFLEKDNTNASIKAWNDYPRNFPIIRPADVLLLYAEALINNGKAGEAKNYLDKIRLRAGLPVLSGTPTLDDVKKERKFEFIGEGRRFFDLVRWGDEEAVNTLVTFARHYHANTNGQLPTKRDLLLPIPQTELNTRTNWTQNEGY